MAERSVRTPRCRAASSYSSTSGDENAFCGNGHRGDAELTLADWFPSAAAEVMAFLKKPALAPFIGLAALILGVAVPMLFVQEAARDALQSTCGLVLVLGGIALLSRLAAPQRDATAPRQAAGGAGQILLGCAILSHHGGARLGLLAGGLLVLALAVSGRMERWFRASA